ncbi:MAG: hypothetical protein C5B50_14755 [Verrucomicrobia bacterium]|nr:MAG: hypothetical protein C5B50_14755 [Verrucomicrobiota bacterium]
MEARFHGVSWENQIVRGIWQESGVIYRDNNTRLILDVPDSAGSREFITNLKQRLKTRFQQLDIWITSHLIDVI